MNNQHRWSPLLVTALLTALAPVPTWAANETLSLTIPSAQAGQTTTATVTILNPADVESFTLELSFIAGSILSLPNTTTWFSRLAYYPSSPFNATDFNYYKNSSGRTRIYINGFNPSGTSGQVGKVTLQIANNAAKDGSQVVSISGSFWSRSEQTVKPFIPAAQEFTIGQSQTPIINIITSTTSLTVPEGKTTQFQAKLSAQPTTNVTITVARSSGDSDIGIQSGGTLTFTTANWNTNQTITLSAAEDTDTTNGSATITLSSAGITSVNVTALESDNDTNSGGGNTGSNVIFSDTFENP